MHKNCCRMSASETFDLWFLGKIHTNCCPLKPWTDSHKLLPFERLEKFIWIVAYLVLHDKFTKIVAIWVLSKNLQKLFPFECKQERHFTWIVAIWQLVKQFRFTCKFTWNVANMMLFKNPQILLPFECLPDISHKLLPLCSIAKIHKNYCSFWHFRQLCLA